MTFQLTWPNCWYRCQISKIWICCKWHNTAISCPIFSKFGGLVQLGMLSNASKDAIQKNNRLLQKCCIAAAKISQSNEFVANSLCYLSSNLDQIRCDDEIWDAALRGCYKVAKLLHAYTYCFFLKWDCAWRNCSTCTVVHLETCG